MLHMAPNSRILTKVIRIEKRERTGDPAKTGKQSRAKDKAWSREETWPATHRGTSRGKSGNGKK